MILLPQLLKILPEARGLRVEEIPVISVTDHSARVQKGAVFVAVRGVSADGHDYLDEVMRKEPAAIIAETKGPADYPGLWVKVSDTRAVLGPLAARFAGDPAASMVMVGVTGTNGKTTVTHFIHALFEKSMIKAGMIGTIKIHDGKAPRPATHTTPSAVEMQSILRTMKANGCRAVTMETSSHGLEQGRCAGIPFRVGVFLNLTQDHLDYHGSMEAYFEAKKILFEQMAADGPDGVVVINIDDPYGARLAESYAGRLKVVTFGFGAAADFRASEVRPSPRGQVFALAARGKSYLVRLPVVGRFNVLNAVAALAAVSSAGVPLRDLVKAIAETRQTPGRMELVGGERISVFVDYAHTPDAVGKACQTLRALDPNHLITVFGCGGDRDRGKRPMMAAAAAAASDICIVTSDNPRTEDPSAIIAEIVPGFGEAAHQVIPDRREAIEAAIIGALPGDIILIAGKGHENYQEVNGKSFHFDDREVARRALEIRRKAEEAEFKKRQEEREIRERRKARESGEPKFPGDS